MHRYWRVQRVRKATSGVRLELEKPFKQYASWRDRDYRSRLCSRTSPTLSAQEVPSPYQVGAVSLMQSLFKHSEQRVGAAMERSLRDGSQTNKLT